MCCRGFTGCVEERGGGMRWASSLWGTKEGRRVVGRDIFAVVVVGRGSWIINVMKLTSANRKVIN
jgi:hypothetical protein